MHVQKCATNKKAQKHATSKSAATAGQSNCNWHWGFRHMCARDSHYWEQDGIVPGTPSQAWLLRMQVQRHTPRLAVLFCMHVQRATPADSPILLLAAAAPAASAEETRQMHMYQNTR
jgi:hypothetical protein